MGERGLKILLLGIVAVIVFVLYGDQISGFLWNAGLPNAIPLRPKYDFTEEKINHIEQEIRDQYQNQSDIEVDEVSMVKDRERHLTGYVKCHRPGLFGIGQISFSRNCSASMDEDSGRGFWQCK